MNPTPSICEGVLLFKTKHNERSNQYEQIKSKDSKHGHLQVTEDEFLSIV